MNLNEFAKKVHENMVNHGFWDENYTEAVVFELINAEISEAFEEWRAGRPMVYYKCDYFDPIPCGKCSLKQNPADCEHRGEKPEGIATELADVVLRILDAAAAWDLEIDFSKNARCLGFDEATLPEVAACLHSSVGEAYTEYCKYGSYDVTVGYFEEMITIIFGWLRTRNIDPEALLQEKHQFNTTRPHKHGGKLV